jgi:N-acetylmuramic acid 6-phosphate etherase
VAVGAAARASRSTARAAEWIVQALGQGGRLIYVGAGTSGRLGVLDSAECPPTFGIPASRVRAVMAGGRRALTRAVEGAEDDDRAGAKALRGLRVSAKDVVCGISASARTPFVLGGLKQAQIRGARTILLCCAPPLRGTPAQLVILARTGPELLAGSTRLKAGTATKLLLNALSTTAMIRLGKVYRGRMIDLQPTNAKLRARSIRIVSELTGERPRRAEQLLKEAKGQVRLALAMAFTGLGARPAAQKLRERGLRALER